MSQLTRRKVKNKNEGQRKRGEIVGVSLWRPITARGKPGTPERRRLRVTFVEVYTLTPDQTGLVKSLDQDASSDATVHDRCVTIVARDSYRANT